ncbi:S28 family serine protease [Saccharicrinis sp. FJH62]|uniref:S28 family serine protease n=1 Tax=Saccharicrinis sp. FJH62 TaxID=3344657 RepID=UPI0035D4C2D9
MKHIFIGLMVVLGFAAPLRAQNNSLEYALYDLPDVVFREIPTRGDFSQSYELHIKQFLDHEHPEKGVFYQRAFLSHKGFDKPMVMYISGYSQRSVYVSEVTQLLDANQLSVEHRFFGESLPDSMDYKYLTIEQATADLHHINELMKQIYKGKWVSTGISKGGATVIFYKYFFPDDVDAAIPYVAPINTELEEKSLYTFLDTVGTDQCRENIFLFQKRMFHHRSEILPLLEMYSEGAGLKFNYLGLEGAFEYAVLEYPFAFWQYGSPCDEIPADTCSLLSAVKYFIKVSNIRLFSDSDIDYFLPHYYQSATQLGYYGYRTERFKEDLKVLPVYPHPNAAIVPQNIPVKFDGSVLKAVHSWAKTKGNRLMYVYGSSDTWTGSAIQPSDKVDAVWFFMKGKNHGSARYKEMTPEEKEKYRSTLERWLGFKIVNSDIR